MFVMNELLMADEEEQKEMKPKMWMLLYDIDSSRLIHFLDLALDDEKWKIGEEQKREDLLKNAVILLHKRKPTTFQLSYNHKDPETRKHWRMAIKKEFSDMIKRGVWRNYKKKDIPSG